MVNARPRLVALALALLVIAAGAAACGQSKQAKVFDQIEEACDTAAANGWTLDQSVTFFRGRDVGPSTPLCAGDAGNLPPPATDTCGTATPQDPTCSVFLEWVATDNNLCNPGGGCCLLCELRVKQSELNAKGVNAPVCASRGAQGQICQLF